MGTEEYLLDKWKRDGIAEGIKKGRAEEKAKAEAEKLTEKNEYARKMIRSGFEIAMISDIIGLSAEEIEKLK